jgi:hypothetical protein
MKRAVLVAATACLAAGCGSSKMAATSRKTTTGPNLPPTGAVLFRDDFGSRRTGWHVGRDHAGSEFYVGGRYRVTVRETDYLVQDSNDLDRASDAVSITATAQQVGGGTGDDFGVVCLKTGLPIQGYAFGIGPADGYVSVFRIRRAKILKTYREHDGESAVEVRGAVNRVRADCFGARAAEPARVRFYVNGTPVAAADIKGGDRRFDGVGLYVYSDHGDTVVRFDDVIVRELERR